MATHTLDERTPNVVYVTVNKGCPAVLMSGVTVNGNRYYAWEIAGREVFISDSVQAAREKMHKAQRDGVTF